MERGLLETSLVALAAILEVEPDSAGFEESSRAPRHILWPGSIARLEIHAERQPERPTHARNDFQKLVERNPLAVGVAKGEGDSGARRGHGGKAGFLEDSGRGHVPGVREQQCSRTLVELQEFSRAERLLSLFSIHFELSSRTFFTR